MPRRNSEAIYSQLCEVIPGGVNSPVRACKAMNQTPLVAEYGFADTIVDADGRHYIDYCGSWGALIHGHAHPQILEATQKRMHMGTSFGITTSIEEKLARKIVNLIPSIEKIRFVSSGTEATMSAVRLARGFTGKPLIIKFEGNYHGHADFFLVKAGSGVAGLNPISSSIGIPEEIVRHTLCLPYNDLDALRKLFGDSRYNDKIAAVILEPIAGNMGTIPATQEFIDLLQELTSKHKSLLIFDEVMTGFRVALKGAQSLYNIKPDLTCFGKIIGGGFPAAAFGGRRDIMDCLAPIGTVYQAGTLSGNPVAMEAGLQALTLLETPGFYEDLERKTRMLIEPIQRVMYDLKLPACIQQVGSMFTPFFGRSQVSNMQEAMSLDQATFIRFFRYLFDNGVYVPPLQLEAWFMSAAHTDTNIEKTRDLIINSMREIF